MPSTDVTFRIRIDGLKKTLRQLQILRLRASLLAAGVAVRKSLPEILTALAFVGGWLLVTAGIASAVADITPRFHSAIWLLSLGLLAISLGGWRLLVRDLMTRGLYDLMSDE